MKFSYLFIEHVMKFVIFNEKKNNCGSLMISCFNIQKKDINDDLIEIIINLSHLANIIPNYYKLILGFFLYFFVTFELLFYF